MKKSIITGILFLVAVSFSAQEKGTKNTKPIKDTKVEIVNPIKPEVFNKEEKTTKVVVTPVNSNSTNRAASSSVNTTKPEKVKGERKNNEKVVNNRAASAPKPTGLNPEKVKEVTKERKPKVKKEK